MAYVLAPDRVTIEIEDGPAVEVGPILAYPVVLTTRALFDKYAAAREPAAEMAALRDLYEYVVAEAQPTWQLLDHKGVVPPTASGMMRLPLPIAFALIREWLDTAREKATAADAMLPDGPAKDTINLALRRKRKAA